MSEIEYSMTHIANIEMCMEKMRSKCKKYICNKIYLFICVIRYDSQSV